MYIDDFIGTRLAEYEVFVQYCNKLIILPMARSLRTHTYELYSCIRHHIMTSHHWIVKYFDHTKGMDDSDTELLLAIIAMELHRGRTSSFYGMLEFMINSKHDPHLVILATEIQLQVKTFDPHKSSGMYTSIHIVTVAHT